MIEPEADPDPNLELLAAMVYDLAERLGDSTLDPRTAGGGAWAAKPEPTARLLSVVRQVAPALVDLCMLFRSVGSRMAAPPPGDVPDIGPDDPAAAEAFHAAGAGLREAGDLLDRTYDLLVRALHNPDLSRRLVGGDPPREIRNPIPGRVPARDGPEHPTIPGEDPSWCLTPDQRHLPDPRTVRWTEGYDEVHVNCRRCGRCGSAPLPRGDDLDWAPPTSWRQPRPRPRPTPPAANTEGA